MKGSIEKLRLEYGNHPLCEKEMALDPLDHFLKWFKEAQQAEVIEPNGMVLATVSPLGRPSSRTVLLKGVDEQGLTFFTHYMSRKGEQIAHHPFVSVTFWWKEIFRQVSMEGRVKKISRKDSEAYFSKRPKGAQLGALISQQSAPLATRAELEVAFAQAKKKYRGQPIPCPKGWGGYRLMPERIEFWQGRQNRLHDRFLYVKTNREWILTRLSP